jgi:dihydrofolate reductase
VAEHAERAGAVVMGRNMFGGGPGPWGDPRWGEGPWRGWWGDEPPFHVPVFVLTHHEREPLEMEGGTTFTFVTDGIEPALAQARAAAKDRDVSIAGGAQTIGQCLAAEALDEIEINLVPVLLGAGERLFEGLPGLPASLDVDRVVAAPGVTHVRYRVG